MSATGARRTLWIPGALLAGLLLGVWLGWSPRAPTETGPLLVDARLPLASEGAVFAFTLPAPSVVRVQVTLEDCTSSGEARVGPLLPALRPHMVYEPDPEREQRFAIHGGRTVSQRLALEAAGVYAVRILGIPRAMGGETQPRLHVVVRRLPTEAMDPDRR